MESKSTKNGVKITIPTLFQFFCWIVDRLRLRKWMARTMEIVARPFVLPYQSDNAPFRVDHGFGIDVGVNLARIWIKRTKNCYKRLSKKVS